MVYKYCLRGSRVGSRVRLDFGEWKKPDDEWFIIANSVCSKAEFDKYISMKFIPVYFDEISDWYGIYNYATRAGTQITAGVMKKVCDHWQGVIEDA